MTAISLCIPTIDRPHQLRSCLDSIRAGSERPLETIVSDDSAGERAARSVVDGFQGVRYQRGPGRGLGPNRNACIEGLSGGATHLAFIDDDVTVPQTFVATLYDLVDGADQHTIITGFELKVVDGRQLEVEPRDSDFLGFQRLPWGLTPASLTINATVFPRRLFDRIRFDENLRYGYEEIDIARHAVACGYRIVFSPELWVTHETAAAKPYGHTRHASRLYSTFKAYWRYEHAYGKAAAYALIGPLHHLAGAVLKQHDESPAESARTIGLALRYLRRDRRTAAMVRAREQAADGAPT